MIKCHLVTNFKIPFENRLDVSVASVDVCLCVWVCVCARAGTPWPTPANEIPRRDSGFIDTEIHFTLKFKFCRALGKRIVSVRTLACL